jgi:thiol:disulfide interchange protein DsbA
MRFMKTALAALCLGLVAATAAASPSNPVNGDDYLTLDRAQPVAQTGKIEVTEFFAYWCPHCNAFDPDISDWVKAHSDRIVFNRVPVAFHDGDDVQQKMYYALEALGKNEALHKIIFHAIHVDRKHLVDENSVADFVASQGVDRAKFVSAYESFGVQTKVQRAVQMMNNYKVNGVPTIAIDGHYETSPSTVGAKLGNVGEHELGAATLQVMDWLVAKTMAEHKQASAAPDAKPAVAKK